MAHPIHPLHDRATCPDCMSLKFAGPIKLQWCVSYDLKSFCPGFEWCASYVEAVARAAELGGDAKVGSYEVGP